MDKLEYIPGDLVMTNGVPLGTVQDVVYRVTSSDPTKTLKLDDGTVMKGVVRLENLEGVEFGDKGYLFGDCCAWVKDIVPINLVTAILEKNGWKKLNTVPINCNILYKSHQGLTIGYNINSKTFIYDFGVNQQEKIKFIHELQHLLFGLGLNSEMDV